MSHANSPSTLGLPGLHSPAAGFDSPFELLSACHDRVRGRLDLLTRLCERLANLGADAAVRDAARDVERYFSQAAPAHHEDEERHLLPLLQASHDPVLREAAERLRADHQAIHAAWAGLAPLLRALGADAPVGYIPLAAAAERFVSAHDGHIELEEDVVFPRCQALLAEHAGALQAMGNEMAERRGVAPLTAPAKP